MAKNISKERTGVEQFNGLEVNADDTKFNHLAGSAYLIDYLTDPKNPKKKHVKWEAQLAITPTFLPSDAGTFIGINAVKTIIQQVEDFNRDQLQYIWRLGRLSHFGNTIVTDIFDLPLNYEVGTDFAQYIMKRGTLKLDDVGGKVGPNTSTEDMSISISDCKYIRIGAGATRENQNFPETEELIGPTIIGAYRKVTGRAELVLPPGTEVDSTKYDDGSGTLASVDSGKFLNVYIYMFPSQTGLGYTIFHIYGHSQNFSMQRTLQIMGSDDFFVPTDIRGGALLACVSMKQGISDLGKAIDDGDAVITNSDIDSKISSKSPDLASILAVAEGNAIADTIIPAVDAKVKINLGAVNFSAGLVENFEVSAVGWIKFIGGKETTVTIDSSIHMEPAVATKNLRSIVVQVKNGSFPATFTNATNTINEVGTAIQDGDVISFKNTLGTLPAELDKDKVYYAINAGVDSFQISYTIGGAAVTFTDDGTPVNSYQNTFVCGAVGRANISASNPSDVFNHSLLRIKKNDYITIFVYNETDAVNISVLDANIRIKD